MTLQAANAARAKAAHKHKIAAYVAETYAATKKPVCQSDIMVALKVCKATVNRAVKELQTEQKIHCVGTAADADRDDLVANVRLYGPMNAPKICRFMPPVPPRKRPAYCGKPAPVAEPRKPSVKYVGEIGRKYAPDWRDQPTRKPEEFWGGRDLAMLSR